MKTKICGHCKKEFPATLEHFYKKVTKAGTFVNGLPLKKDCTSLKHVCKVCHGKIHVLRSQKKRAKELNISLEEYQANSDKIGRAQSRISKLKYKEFKDLPPKECAKNVRRVNAGYKLEDVKDPEKFESVKKERLKQKCINNRKYDYSDFEDMYPLTIHACNVKYHQVITPALIALRMNLPVKELTPELYELGKKSRLLVRQVKSLIKN
jgi:hypothetical protein